MTRTASAFDYATMVGRNLGLVTESEQSRLRETPVFVAGLGGMGGACLQALVRAGVTRLFLADPDRFEASNMNRQVFATAETLGERKIEATVRALRQINPEVQAVPWGDDWTDHLGEILGPCKVVINAMDDFRAGILLYREARRHRATVIDAYLSPLPSVTRVHPDDPRPEERLGFPTVGLDPGTLPEEALHAARRLEAEYVLTHSSSADYVDLSLASDVLSGRRPRPSFAPVVLLTGVLMAAEAIALILGRPSAVDSRGLFFDFARFRVERPRGAVAAWLRRTFVRRRLRRLLG